MGCRLVQGLISLQNCWKDVVDKTRVAFEHRSNCQNAKTLERIRSCQTAIRILLTTQNSRKSSLGALVSSSSSPKTTYICSLTGLFGRLHFSL